MFNIAICDDERIEAETIQKYIEEFMKERTIVYHITIFDSGEKLLQSSRKFDFIFLDISMQGVNGIEAGVKLYEKNRNNIIIYITSFREYCSDAVNHVHAFAYLAKPVDKELLKNQLIELMKIKGEEKAKSVEVEFFNITEIGEKAKEYPVIYIPISDILYFEYMKASRKIQIVTWSKVFECSDTMVQVESKMGIFEFGTCFRGILVNLEYVMDIRGDDVWLNNGKILPLSQKRIVEFKEQLSDYIHRSL